MTASAVSQGQSLGHVRNGRLPRLGFLGVGWIGRNRLDAIVGSGVAEVAAVADPALEEEVHGLAPLESLEELLALDLDGLVIATPSAFHAEQAGAALDRGLAVFCQKPLGRTAAEARAVVEAARRADRLLAVDLSYRHVEAVRAVRAALARGEVGDVFAANLVFHNAYGPDKAWFYDPRLSGGGCVIDLGTHLVDLALWALEWPALVRVAAELRRGAEGDGVEQYATAQLELENGTLVRLACSWNLPLGQDCVFEASFYGSGGDASVRNVGGSFYDFRAELYRGAAAETLAEPPDAWGGRAAVEWAERLTAGQRFDAAAEQHVRVAEAIDAIYGRRG